MATTVRFRPVVIGEPPTEGVVYYFIEEGGRVFFEDGESVWPIDSALESVSPGDVPECYRNWGAQMRVLPVRVAGGATDHEAGTDLLRQLETLAEKGLAAEPAAGAGNQPAVLYGGEGGKR